VRWSQIRDKHIEAISREDLERGTSRPISQVRAHRLADKRKRRGLTSAKSHTRENNLYRAKTCHLYGDLGFPC
jgi:hypothetical protein